MEKVRITVFADPTCTWCWGSVPILRALSYRYGGQLEISYVMGGMIEDILYNEKVQNTVQGIIDFCKKIDTHR